MSMDDAIDACILASMGRGLLSMESALFHGFY